MRQRGFQIQRHRNRTETYSSFLLTWASLRQYAGLRTLSVGRLCPSLYLDGPLGPQAPKSQMQSHWLTAWWPMQVSPAGKGRHRSDLETLQNKVFFPPVFQFPLEKICRILRSVDIKFSILILKTKSLIQTVSSLLNMAFLSPRTTRLFIFCACPMRWSSIFPLHWFFSTFSELF